MPKPISTNGTSASALPSSVNLTFDGSALRSVTSLTEPGIANSSPLKRSFRKLNRPSTAPSHEEVILLPAGPSAVGPSGPSEPFLREERYLYAMPDSKDAKPEKIQRMQTVNEDDGDSAGGSANDSFNAQGPSSQLLSTAIGDMSTIIHSDCDWATFIHAYASGRWGPHRTPNPPRSCLQVSGEPSQYLATEVTRSTTDLDPLSYQTLTGPKINADPVAYDTLPPEIMHTMSEGQVPANWNGNEKHSQHGVSTSAGPSIPASLKFHGRNVKSLNLPLPSHRLRNSFSNPSTDEHYTSISSVSNADVHTAVATMRWAAARVDISPLALPSPEHELTDPMRGMSTSIPVPHLPESYDYVTTPGGTRKPRLTSFWQGTTDVTQQHTPGQSEGPSRLAPLLASPEPSPETDDGINTPSDVQSPNSAISDATRHLSLLATAIPASAPAVDINHGRASSESVDDYFGNVNGVTSPNNSHPNGAPSIMLTEVIEMPESGTVTVPALPRRICLTRQTSSPLPESSPHESRFFAGRVVSDSSPAKAGRAAKEEQMFADLGYLAPPYPPDELERRRELYKFNIWKTGPDHNFDRIAHLAKLVFNTKGAIISLIDGNEQWFKSEWGLKTTICSRMHSFCGHAILQRGDEPMIVLDTQLDWRFAKNPLVTGAPYIKFYAGAPLRTQDGFNLGTLAVIDDAPRTDFTPRQRHTLKEFAAIAMREMELWRDKIQLRIRDRIQNSMEQFSRECLEIDTKVQSHERPDLNLGSSMDRVYDRAAKLVKRTLDVEGVIVMDVSHYEVLESMSAEGTVSVSMHYGDPQLEMTKRQLSTEEYHNLNLFFAKYPDGKISEGIIPPSFKPFLPTHIQYALTVPIFNIDKRPFALLCAYNANDHSKRSLEGHELSYLRAIGVIILSAVLKRRMILADKAKSLFISNISHELRTPLHGILAAAELLSESSLNHSQLSFLQTVQACGTSLVETVNHVLDFTKLSGNSKGGGVENVISSSKVDLMQLVEEAVDGCWIGHRARTAMGDSGIGSVYSPPADDKSPLITRRKNIETVVDIGYRKEGWVLKCEKGGIRRVLMNLFGNSLKFTTDGFVHVTLRQIPNAEGDPPDKVKIELSVFDTGKGISQNFLKNQLFHPFTQENPLQAGTGLGLAIVSSIVTSESVGGKVEVWSEEGVGTEIKVIFLADVSEEDSESSVAEMEPFKFDDDSDRPTVSMVGFESPHKGVQLLKKVMQNYITDWWGFKLDEGPSYGNLVILNDDATPVIAATARHDTTRPFIILSAGRGNPGIMAIASEHELIGGFCRILYKPGGPSRLRSIFKLCVHALKIGSQSRGMSPYGNSETASFNEAAREVGKGNIPRRNSEENRTWSHHYPMRPSMTRSSTAHPAIGLWPKLPPTSESNETSDPDTTVPTITFGSSGTLLQSSVGTVNSSARRFKVLVVEDNSILRNLLSKWLSIKGYDFRVAVDGRDGVNVYEKEWPFDVVLLDLSMPVLDGVAATAEIRRIENSRAESAAGPRFTRILALTGMSSLEDKRRAFEAGVDGYLVKPVAFKTLDDMFHKLGIS